MAIQNDKWVISSRGHNNPKCSANRAPQAWSES